jgi:exo-beta-1,3-glucanase (GH17 family)
MEKRKSASQLAEEASAVAEIAKATSFSAAIVLGGPGGRHAHHGLASYAEAEAMESELNKLSRYGRKAVIYAVRGERATPCTPDLIVQARLINPAL